jgi:hypothetical protein
MEHRFPLIPGKDFDGVGALAVQLAAAGGARVTATAKPGPEADYESSRTGMRSFAEQANHQQVGDPAGRRQPQEGTPFTPVTALGRIHPGILLALTYA